MRLEADAAAARKYFCANSHELERKQVLFKENAAFVLKVKFDLFKEGGSLAAGMDPDTGVGTELRTLEGSVILAHI